MESATCQHGNQLRQEDDKIVKLCEFSEQELTRSSVCRPNDFVPDDIKSTNKQMMRKQRTIEQLKIDSDFPAHNPYSCSVNNVDVIVICNFDVIVICNANLKNQYAEIRG